PAHLAGVQPADVDVGRDAEVVVGQPQVCDVLEPPVRVPRTPGLHRGRRCVQQQVDDGDVVRSEVPDDVDVALVEPEVQPPGVDVEQLPQLSAAHELAQPEH